MPRALICGVSGQDGAYLAALLLDKGYQVHGTTRDVATLPLSNLRALGLLDRVAITSMAPTDYGSVLAVLDQVAPDEVYLLAGQTSVGLSYEQPVEAVQSIVLGTLNLLEAMRFRRRPVRLYHASSSECFGDIGRSAANEETPFSPQSPYAVAKASAHWLVANYRAAYGLYACNGILFNHESPLRPQRFVTRKVVAAAARIWRGEREPLRLGRLDVVRDWGWAPEYVESMWAMLQQPSPADLVIATGTSSPLSSLVAQAFDQFGLDWRDHVVIDAALVRPADQAWSQGDPRRAAAQLGWQSRCDLAEIVRRLCDAERQIPSAGATLRAR